MSGIDFKNGHFGSNEETNNQIFQPFGSGLQGRNCDALAVTATVRANISIRVGHQ